MSGRTPAVRAGLDVETALAAERRGAGAPALVAGMDEVGRGALAGPVTVGVCAVRVPVDREVPPVRDSKALTDRRRRALVPEIEGWAAGVALGEASPGEVDELGITGALALAGCRAWSRLVEALGEEPVALVLDGADDWLRHARPGGTVAAAVAERVAGPVPPVPHMMVRAEDRCASVAAASICAKVARDDVMVGLHTGHPAYGWAGNKGYGAAVHRQAILAQGVTEHHRRSWSLGMPGTGPAWRAEGPAAGAGSAERPDRAADPAEPAPPPTLFD